ncbi:hypothetical protein [Escherichia fergusonii]|nr:hypothetical protein [Escherichia fergusonii]MBZ4073222.1 hypothetical protein [Escherichia fergusonii]MBZ4077457.1 hypothetical protein [Escherichia fergusonii]MBZ4081890.1 hypothetical protein [Escherichia fergusonii]MBZ4087321.1 hypothetical protein [Escherichia fergusonii]MBZ4090929.1 hypothetical protein [Escherichia fergusonii]
MAKNNNHLLSNIDNFSIHKKYTHIFDIAFVKFGARLADVQMTLFKNTSPSVYTLQCISDDELFFIDIYEDEKAVLAEHQIIDNEEMIAFIPNPFTAMLITAYQEAKKQPALYTEDRLINKRARRQRLSQTMPALLSLRDVHIDVRTSNGYGEVSYEINFSPYTIENGDWMNAKRSRNFSVIFDEKMKFIRVQWYRD